MAGLTTALVGGALVGSQIYEGEKNRKAARRSAEAQEIAAREGISEQRLARESFEERTDPFRLAGAAAIPGILSELGIAIPQELQEQFGEAPSTSLADDRTTQLFDFLSERGRRGIEESAAAQGRLRSGGTLEDLTQFQSNLANQFALQQQQQRFGNLFNLLRLGSNVAAGQGTAGMGTASNIANLLGNVGQAQAQGIQGRRAAESQTIGGLTQLLGFGMGGGFGGGAAATPSFSPTPGLPSATPQQIFM